MECREDSYRIRRDFMSEIGTRADGAAEIRRRRPNVGADGAKRAVPQVRRGTAGNLLRPARGADVVHSEGETRPRLRREGRNRAHREGK